MGGSVKKLFRMQAKSARSKSPVRGRKVLGLTMTDLMLRTRDAGGLAGRSGDEDLSEQVEGEQGRTRNLLFGKQAKEGDVKSLLTALRNREDEIKSRRAAPFLQQTKSGSGSLLG